MTYPPPKQFTVVKPRSGSATEHNMMSFALSMADIYDIMHSLPQPAIDLPGIPEYCLKHIELTFHANPCAPSFSMSSRRTVYYKMFGKTYTRWELYQKIYELGYIDKTVLFLEQLNQFENS